MTAERPFKTSFICLIEPEAFPNRNPAAIMALHFPSDFTFPTHHEKHRSVFRARRPWLHRIEHCRSRAGRHPQPTDRQFERRAASGAQCGQGWLNPSPAQGRTSGPAWRRTDAFSPCLLHHGYPNRPAASCLHGHDDPAPFKAPLQPQPGWSDSDHA